jgi:hypothetical protein
MPTDRWFSLFGGFFGGAVVAAVIMIGWRKVMWWA